MTREEAIVKITIAQAAIEDVARNYKDELGRSADLLIATPIERALDESRCVVRDLISFLQCEDLRAYSVAIARRLQREGFPIEIPQELLEEEQK